MSAQLAATASATASASANANANSSNSNSNNSSTSTSASSSASSSASPVASPVASVSASTSASTSATTATTTRTRATRARRPRPKRHQCPYCWVALSNSGQLRGHVRIHTGERPYLCEHPCCNKTFTRNEELTRHRRIHTGLRPFSCPVCNKSFGRKDHLKKHTRTHEKNGIIVPNLNLSTSSAPAIMSGRSSASSGETSESSSTQDQQPEIKSEAEQGQVKHEGYQNPLLATQPPEQYHPFATYPAALVANAAAFASPCTSLLMAQNYPMQHAFEWPSPSSAPPQAPNSLFDFSSNDALAAAAAANQHWASIASMNNSLAMQQYLQQQQQQQYQLTHQQLDLIYRLGAVAQQSLIHPQTSAPSLANYWQNAHIEGSTAESSSARAALT